MQEPGPAEPPPAKPWMRSVRVGHGGHTNVPGLLRPGRDAAGTGVSPGEPVLIPPLLPRPDVAVGPGCSELPAERNGGCSARGDELPTARGLGLGFLLLFSAQLLLESSRLTLREKLRCLQGLKGFN